MTRLEAYLLIIAPALAPAALVAFLFMRAGIALGQWGPIQRSKDPFSFWFWVLLYSLAAFLVGLVISASVFNALFLHR
jgi:hypothetical protein